MDNSFESPAAIVFEQAPEQRFPWVNVALFGLTCLSTLLMGTALMAMYTNSLADLFPFLEQIGEGVRVHCHQRGAHQQRAQASQAKQSNVYPRKPLLWCLLEYDRGG